MKTNLLIALSLFVSSIAFVACKKDHAQSTLNVRMTDAPLDVEEVNVDLKEVRVNFNHDTAAWIKLDTKAGIYNLLGLQNGIDSLIAQGTFDADLTVKEIRLVLGSDNTIKVDGQSYPLTIPSGSESGLKIKVDKKLHSTIETTVIDFDAALSIKEESDGYKLSPVVKLK